MKIGEGKKKQRAQPVEYLVNVSVQYARHRILTSYVIRWLIIKRGWQELITIEAPFDSDS